MSPTESGQERPLGVIWLAGGSAISSAILLWMGIVILNAGSGLDAWLPLETSGVPAGFVGAFMPLMILGSSAGTRALPAIILLSIAWLAGMTAIGLWNLKSWARTNAIVLCAAGMVTLGGGGIFSALMRRGEGVVSLLLAAVFAFSVRYLYLPVVREAFGLGPSGRFGLKTVLGVSAAIGLFGFAILFWYLMKALAHLR